MSGMQKKTQTHSRCVELLPALLWLYRVDLPPPLPPSVARETTVRNGRSQTGSMADAGKRKFVFQPGGSASAPIDPPPNRKTLRRLLDPVGFGQLLSTAIGGFSPVIYYKRGLWQGAVFRHSQQQHNLRAYLESSCWSFPSRCDRCSSPGDAGYYQLLWDLLGSFEWISDGVWRYRPTAAAIRDPTCSRRGS